MTPHHQIARWKYRSPVRSACQAFRVQTIVAKIHGGLPSHQYRRPLKKVECHSRGQEQADGRPKAQSGGKSGRVGVKGDMKREVTRTYVGKKLTKLSPSSCAQPMTEKTYTLGSLRACFRPVNALLMVSLGKMRKLIHRIAYESVSTSSSASPASSANRTWASRRSGLVSQRVLCG